MRLGTDFAFFAWRSKIAWAVGEGGILFRRLRKMSQSRRFSDKF